MASFSKFVLAVALCALALPASAATETLVNGRLSGNWAGYVATRAQFSGVGASWVVPRLAATTTLMTDVAWVGIGGSKSKDLIQAGTHSAVQNGQTQYWAWYELLPDYQKRIPLEVKGGDKVTVALTEVVPDVWLLSFANETTGKGHYQTFEYRSRRNSAEWIEEMPVVYDRRGERIYAPLSEFGTIVFEDAWAIVGGRQVPIEDTRAKAVTMVSRTNNRMVLATPSPLQDGGFSVERSGVVPSPVSGENSGKRYRGNTWEIIWTKP